MASSRAHYEGHIQVRKRTYAPEETMVSTYENGTPVENNFFAHQLRRESSNKATAKPVKILIDENMSQEVEVRRPAPGVVARLMGLDTVSLPLVDKEQKNLRNLHKRSSVCSEQQYMDHTTRMHNIENQDFKDVFEVIEASRVEKHKAPTVRGGMLSSKKGETDMAISSKSVEAKYPPMHETVQNNKHCDCRTEVLDRNKDLFLKFLQEPNPLFRKHLHDLKSALPSEHASHITILKSSKSCKSEHKAVTSGRNPERCTHIQRDAISCSRKSATRYGCQSPEEHSRFVSKSRDGEKAAIYRHSSEIVVLEATLRKAQGMTPLASSNVNSQSSSKRNMELLTSGTRDLSFEGKGNTLSDNEVLMRHKTKSSRKNARELAEHVRHIVSSNSEKIIDSKVTCYRMNDSSCTRSVMDNRKKSKEFRWTSDHFDDCGNRFGASLSTNREARKRLSERWIMTRLYQEARAVGRKSSTLGEMLALPDEDKQKTIKHPMIPRRFVKKEAATGKELPTSVCPASINRKDSWKNRCSTNLLTSTTCPDSPSDSDNPEPNRRNHFGRSNDSSIPKDVTDLGFNDSLDGKFGCQRIPSVKSIKCRSNSAHICPFEDRNIRPECGAPVNCVDLRNKIYVGYPDEEKNINFEPFDFGTSIRRRTAKSFSNIEDNGTRIYSKTNKELLKQSNMLCVKDAVLKEISTGHPQVDFFSSGCISESEINFVSSPRNNSEPGSPASPDKAERPSPLSTFEACSDQENSGSGCFKKISTYLQDLPMQLQFLKLEPTDKYSAELDLISSDEEIWEECNSGTLQKFRDEEERDFSYLLDIIIESGVCSSEWNLLNARISLGCPVGAYIFDRLEKKYSLLESWSRKERKLLFDLVNAILADNVVPLMDLHPWVNPQKRTRSKLARESFVEEIWQIVVSQRNESSHNLMEKYLKIRWFNAGNEIDSIGGEIERILIDDLLEEYVSQLIFV